MIPNSREEKVQWIKENLLPLFDSQLRNPSIDEDDQDLVEKSKTMLAEEYLDETGRALKSPLKLSILLVIVDILTYMPPQVYGLVFSTTGTLYILIESDLSGSETITARSTREVGMVFGGYTSFNEEAARQLAQNTVHTNIGLIWLTGGFLMQILAVWVIPLETLIEPVVNVNQLWQWVPEAPNVL